MSTGFVNRYHRQTNGVANDVHVEVQKMDRDAVALTQRANYKHEWQAVDALNEVIKAKLSPMAQLQSNTKVINFRQAVELEKMLDLSLDEDETGFNWSGVLKLVEQAIDHSVKTGHSYYCQQLFNGQDPYGYMAAVLLDALNTSAYTFDVGPVLTVIENEVVRSIGRLMQWPTVDGIFCPGGSMANMYGISLARHAYDANYKTQGMRYGKQLMIFCSEQAHYSTEKGAVFMGFGTDSLVQVKTNDKGQMIVEDLEKKLRENSTDNKHALIVVATMGTTVLNAYDPLEEIADVCKRYKICMGGAALHSSKNRHVLNGIERSDSVAWCWHKVLGAPFQTSLFLCQQKGLLAQAHGANASYLFLTEKHYDTTYDTGDASIQCGRRGDALKVWLMWKARGSEQIGVWVDEAFENARYLQHQLEKRSDRFAMVCDAQGTSTCFWVRPPSLQKYSIGEILNDNELSMRLSKVAPALKKRMVHLGTAMIAYQPISCKNYPNFFRVTFKSHPLNTKHEIDGIVKHLVELSDDL